MPPKQLSGFQKRKRKRLDEAMRKSQTGALRKFLKPQHSNVDANDDAHVNANDDANANANDDASVDANIDANVDANDDAKISDVEDDVEVNIDEDNVEVNFLDIYDPRNWGKLSDDMIKVLVEKGPKRDNTIVKGPKDRLKRRFSSKIYTRILPNREKCDREWLVYSKEIDSLFCFCCKLFNKGHSRGSLDDEGFKDWGHATDRLKEHEISMQHLRNMSTWFDMRRRLKKNETIDKVAYEQFKKERDRWKQVILRIISLVKYLARYGLAFRGKNEKLYKKNNGIFLGAIEILEEFDPIIKEHVRRVVDDRAHIHYLGHSIQNELISLLGDAIKLQIIKKIKDAKYYLIIFDCTPDISHQEQMSIVMRYVNLSTDSIIVEESFLGFLNVDDTTGKGLFEITSNELKSLDLDIDDMRGQGYDNGSNMRGNKQGVQTGFLNINRRAFYTPCGCHSLNLTLSDIANSCTKAKSFFGLIQRVYTIFAKSVNRWKILSDNVKKYTPKSMSATRWENHVDSVKAIRFQLLEIRLALLEVEKKDNDPKFQSEATSLANTELGDFEFLVSIIIWYQVLDKVNVVSKKMQSKDMVLDVAIEDVSKLMRFFNEFREAGLPKAIEEAKEIAFEMGIEPVFPQRRPIVRRKHFDENSSEPEVIFLVEDDYKVNFFLKVVDHAIASLKSRFEQFKQYEEVFGFLFPKKLKELEDKELKSCCIRLENVLKDGKGEVSDIDGVELYSELKHFRASLSREIITPIDALASLKQAGRLPNVSIAYRVLLTIPVTVASAEKSFSKLKLIKSYLRSTMSQERLNGLGMIAIESDVLENIEYEDLINNFVSKNARRASRLM